MSERYEPHSFEEGWIAEWESRHIHEAPAHPNRARKRYVLEMFPYPSGDMHMGHVENFTIGDTLARYLRMQGLDVMHPMGYDAFGLPAENAAIKRGVHPKDWTYSNIERFEKSLRRFGFSYDWNRRLVTADPQYYRWNQWLFLKMFERGLAYRKMAPVNWCPSCKTVLANEQISQGVCWRCGSTPEIRDLTQWFLRTTDYAQRLLDDMDGLDWSERVLVQQRNWIGRSDGAEVAFHIKEHGSDVVIFTTRPDTLWGATFFLLAPEHPLARELVRSTNLEEKLAQFVNEVRNDGDISRQSTAREPKGMFIGAHAVNPVNGEELPVWVSDYVLMSYGTGAVMAVPAHDQRDFEFARRFGLPVRPVIQPQEGSLNGDDMQTAFSGAGVMLNSGHFDGTQIDPSTQAGIREVIDWLQKENLGKATVNYRLRDWLISRQRYWGTPIPIVHCSSCGEVPVAEEDLPVTLPDEADFRPGGEVSPLGRVRDWVEVSCPRCGNVNARRETDTMDTFVDSSWYFLRYCDPLNDSAPFDPQKANEWCPVDRYIGGIEHAVMHLIYARFLTKVLNDMGLVNFSEPFRTLFNQGMITMGGKVMSKSLGNIVEPSTAISRYGADANRVYILFSSPPDQEFDWPEEGVDAIGKVAFSWLARVWRVLLEVSDSPVEGELARIMHTAIRRVGETYESMRFNLVIARLMEFLNELAKLERVPREAAQTFLMMLCPIAPFIAQELWHRYGNEGDIGGCKWPQYDPDLSSEREVVMVVQVNGKVRDRIAVAPDVSSDEMRDLALSSQKVRPYLGLGDPRVVVVPPKLVNVVTT